MSVSTSGFALRFNGSCAANEVDCGTTVGRYHACCPSGSHCPTQYNVDCCPTAANCTETLLKKPQCANETWDLYDNYGYFCCEKGFTGYGEGISDGCAEPGYAFKGGQVLLPILSSGQATSSTVSSTASSSASTSSPPSSTSTPQSMSGAAAKSHTGAIVGGVVGGIGGVILVALGFWLWWRKTHSTNGAVAHSELPGQEVALDKYSIAVPLRSELDGHYPYSEASGVPEPGQLATQHGVSELQG